MKKVALLVLVLVLFTGCSYTVNVEKNDEMNKATMEGSEKMADKNNEQLHITTSLFMFNDQPEGVIVEFTGAINAKMHLNNNALDNNEQIFNRITDGHVIGMYEYYWAGVNENLQFIAKDNRLQIQRILSFEEGGDDLIEVLAEYSFSSDDVEYTFSSTN